MLTTTTTVTHGFHPRLRVVLDQDNAECDVHVLLTLPPPVFVDPYELRDYHAEYTFVRAGQTDLELPVAAVADEPSYVLLNVQPNVRTLDIPLHLRYGAVGHEPFQAVHISSPVGFCSQERMYSSEDVFQFQIPIGQAGDLPTVEAGTALTVMVCFVYIAWMACKTALRLHEQTHVKVA